MSNFQHSDNSVLSSSKGTADFEAAFAQLFESMTSPHGQESSVVETTEHATNELEKALENISLKERQDEVTANTTHGCVTQIRDHC